MMGGIHASEISPSIPNDEPVGARRTVANSPRRSEHWRLIQELTSSKSTPPATDPLVKKKSPEANSKNCRLALQEIGVVGFRPSNREQQRSVKDAIDNLLISRKMTKNELASFVIDKVLSFHGLGAGGRIESMHVLGTLALDPELSYQTWKEIVVKLFSIFSNYAFSGAHQSRQIAASALNAILNTRGKEELEFLQNYIFDNWHELTKELDLVELGVMMPGIVHVSSKMTDKNDMFDVYQRFHSLMRREVAEQLADKRISDQNRDSLNHLATELTKGIDLLFSEIARDTSKQRGLSFKQAPKLPKTNAPVFYTQYQFVFTEARRLDSLREIEASDFEFLKTKDSKLAYEFAEGHIDQLIENATEAHNLIFLAKNPSERYSAMLLLQERYSSLLKLAGKLRSMEAAYRRRGSADIHQGVDDVAGLGLTAITSREPPTTQARI
jgi:hypothetical protein